jgi:hypothetical protein
MLRRAALRQCNTRLRATRDGQLALCGCQISAAAHVLAARCARVLAASSPPENERAQGRPGARRARGPPAEKKQAAVTTGSAETARPSLRDGVTVAPRSPQGPAFLPLSSRDPNASRVRDNACALRGCTTLARPHGITTGMPGPHGLAVRESAPHEASIDEPVPARQNPARCTDRCRSSGNTVAAHRSPPQRIVTTRTPLCMRRDGRQDACDLGSVQGGLFFARDLDRGDGVERMREIGFWARSGSRR